MTDHDGDVRSPRTIAGTDSLGVSPVRPRREPHGRGEDPQRAVDREAVVDRSTAGFTPEAAPGRARDRWKAMALVLFVLVTLTLAAETVAQVAAGLDGLALGATRDLAFLGRIDSALSTAATRASSVAVAAAALSLVAGAVGVVAAVCSRH